MIFLAPDASTGKRKKVHPEKKKTLPSMYVVTSSESEKIAEFQAS